MKIALSGLGIEECVDVPVAVNDQGNGHFVARGNAHVLHSTLRILYDPSAFIQSEFAVHQIPMRFGEPTRVVGTAFFIRFGQKNHVAVQRDAILHQLHDRLGEDGYAALVIHRASAINIAILHHTRERIDGPLLAFHTHDVRVRREQYGLLGSVAFDSGDEMYFVCFRRGNDFNFDAERAKLRRQ